MMNHMDDLITFLRARLDEDEQTARAADPALSYMLGAIEYAYDKVEADQRHALRHSPARVLAEVDAKRRIIAQWEDVRSQARNPISAANYQATRIEQGALADVLRLFGACYADHPDYREAWRY